jgi:hypothetical protein
MTDYVVRISFGHGVTLILPFVLETKHYSESQLSTVANAIAAKLGGEVINIEEL